MQGLIATKVGMSRVFLDSGSAVPVTYLKVKPNTVVRTKSEEKDGYNAVVLGTSPRTVNTRKGNEFKRYRTQKEWKLESIEGFNNGMEVSAAILPKDTIVTVVGVSKGKGFQGVIKRHNFAQGPKTHGSHHHRRPGSVGMCEYPGRVLKGKKMPGRMGNDQVTLHKRAVLVCNPEEGIIAVKGPVPGPNGSYVYITVEQWPDGFEVDAVLDKKVGEVVEKVESEEVKEEVKEEPKEEVKDDKEVKEEKKEEKEDPKAEEKSESESKPDSPSA